MLFGTERWPVNELDVLGYHPSAPAEPAIIFAEKGKSGLLHRLSEQLLRVIDIFAQEGKKMCFYWRCLDKPICLFIRNTFGYNLLLGFR